MQFLETNPELGNNYNEVIAPQDVAIYGGLCALASFDRTETKLDNLNFRNFLELVPEVRELINDFYSRCSHLVNIVLTSNGKTVVKDFIVKEVPSVVPVFLILIAFRKSGRLANRGEWELHVATQTLAVLMEF
ncbi:hypothetical protein G4B88_016578 [Cannabis sativa]|uniref:26S proteasome regulatory subunit Rpn7 N-terminal domain-containing protein n=1 Tax=Cannabis sativa TaxID=3483 RepID=A0A7J6H9J4_CANSA|nr:hypothetical protein G4B88_016578 [Cannabis sativa]